MKTMKKVDQIASELRSKILKTPGAVPYWINEEDSLELDNSLNCPRLDNLDTVPFINNQTTMTETTTIDHNPFLPEDYQEPSNSDYVKLDAGEHKLRIIQNPILCYDIWYEKEEDGQTKKWSETFRQVEGEPIPIGAKVSWTCLAYNYGEKRVQVWNISQKTIRDKITKLYRHKDYGSPLNYDLNIIREGSGQNDTKYEILPGVKSELPEVAKKAIASVKVDWDVYFDNDSKESPLSAVEPGLGSDSSNDVPYNFDNEE